MVSPKTLWVNPSSLKESVLYTLRLTTPDGLVDYADIVVEEGGYRVSEYEGDRDGGDLSGGGPPSGNQPGGGESAGGSGGNASGGDQSDNTGGGSNNGSQPGSGSSDGSAGDGVQESYGPDEITISGKRANDLANRQNFVVFDFGDTKVSIPSRQIQDLHLENNSYLSVKTNREDDGSLRALVATEEGLLDVSTTVSETGQNSQTVFTTGVVAVFTLGVITVLICGIVLVARRRGVGGACL